MNMRGILIAAASMTVAGCSSGEDREAAQQQVALFHDMFSARQFEPIYAAASPALREQTPKATFLEFISAVHRKLGPVQNTKQQGWHVNYGTAGTHVTLGYETKFARGTGVETFVYRSSGSTPRLVSYNINSAALVIR